MCFYFKQSNDAQTLKNRFKVKAADDLPLQSNRFNAFTHPYTPIISNKNVDEVNLYKWGLIPSWAKDTSIQRYTLNAKIETLSVKPSFKNNIKNRCLIITDGFFEWKWLDEKGKQKQQYEIELAENNIFTLAGLWSDWIDKNTGEIISSYTIVTTEAIGIMAEIHNAKKRMPIILTPQNEQDWLNGNDYKTFAKPDVELVVREVV